MPCHLCLALLLHLLNRAQLSRMAYHVLKQSQLLRHMCGICLTRQKFTWQACQADITHGHSAAQITEDRSLSTQLVSLCPLSCPETRVSCNAVQDEVEEVEAKLEASEQQPRTKLQRILTRLCTPVFLEALILTFLAGKSHDACFSCLALCRQSVLFCNIRLLCPLGLEDLSTA